MLMPILPIRNVMFDKKKRFSGSFTDVLTGDTIVVDTPTPSIMIEEESQLSDLSMDDYPAGSIAYTAGFGAMWQRGADGNWVRMV